MTFYFWILNNKYVHNNCPGIVNTSAAWPVEGAASDSMDQLYYISMLDWLRRLLYH